jgi:hypothetical protein
MGQGIKMMLACFRVGGLAAVAVSQAITSVLYGVSALDVCAFAAVFLVMMVEELLANYLPGCSATRVNPAALLHSE